MVSPPGAAAAWCPLSRAYGSDARACVDATLVLRYRVSRPRGGVHFVRGRGGKAVYVHSVGEAGAVRRWAPCLDRADLRCPKATLEVTCDAGLLCFGSGLLQPERPPPPPQAEAEPLGAGAAGGAGGRRRTWRFCSEHSTLASQWGFVCGHMQAVPHPTLPHTTLALGVAEGPTSSEAEGGGGEGGEAAALRGLLAVRHRCGWGDLRAMWLQHAGGVLLKGALERGEQAMLFLNRRGYAPLTLCRACGHRLDCPNCSSWLVEHRFRRELQCHHCGYMRPVPVNCPSCGEEDSLVPCGPGVERIAEEVALRFPEARLSILASDNLHGPAAFAEAVRAIEAREIDLIIVAAVVDDEDGGGGRRRRRHAPSLHHHRLVYGAMCGAPWSTVKKCTKVRSAFGAPYFIFEAP